MEGASSLEIEKTLKSLNGNYFMHESEEDLIDQVNNYLIEGKTIGWFQGREEFGPRALGSRSIIVDARNLNMQKVLNLRIKFRESFRPFAPAILEEKVNEWFDIKFQSPYMLFVADLISEKRIKLSDNDKKEINNKRSQVPAVTHVDYSARIQTVNKENGIFYRLIKDFYKKTKCPMIINTSFNINREPIVGTIEDAYRTFLVSGLDILVCGNFILHKKDQYD